MFQRSALRPGAVRDIRYLGRVNGQENEHDILVFYLVYISAVDGGQFQSASLFLPEGRPPALGWPASVWCHGFGDPATQLRRWPLVGQNWRDIRGHLAGRWAHFGIATLAPWLPGDGPSEPHGTYSPLSLDRNMQAVTDAFSVLGKLDERISAGPAAEQIVDTSPVFRIDSSRLVLRADCVSSPLLIHCAAHWRQYPQMAGLRALVADDFQPSIAYNEHYLGRFVNRLPPTAAAAIRCIWVRAVWSLFQYEGWPLEEVFNEQAIDLFSRPVNTSVGQLDRILADRLVPPQRSRLAIDVADAVTAAIGREANGKDVSDWIYAPRLREWASLNDIELAVRSPFYQQYFGASDPFFPETITPFEPGLPFFLVSRAGRDAVGLRGLPGFSDRYRNMTAPKVRTLKSWGWNVREFGPMLSQGTSYEDGPAQVWVLRRITDIFRQS